MHVSTVSISGKIYFNGTLYNILITYTYHEIRNKNVFNVCDRKIEQLVVKYIVSLFQILIKKKKYLKEKI